jgi:hypothetical protein
VLGVSTVQCPFKSFKPAHHFVIPAVTSLDSSNVRIGRYLYRTAETSDFEQIHRFNYDTFVTEVPQHADDGSGSLTDKFHAKNTYFVALEGARLVGMVAVHDTPPFSVTAKLGDPAILDSLAGPLLEVRLLAIRPECRHASVLVGLITCVYRYALRGHYTYVLISGLLARHDMYARMGFRPLGPPVKSGSACFVPMAACIEEAVQTTPRLVAWLDRLIQE